MVRVRLTRCLSWLAVLTLLDLTAGCGLMGSAGPLENLTEGGQPQFGVAWIADSAGQSADFTAFVVNNAQGPVTLVSASLVPIDGHAVGRLIHLAVGAHHDGVAADRGWPPSVPVMPFKGTQLSHGQSNIIFGFEGSEIGRAYMAAGIKIVYQYQGKSYSMIAWSSAVSCVVKKFSNAGDAACSRLNDVAKHATEKLAGV